MQRPASTPAQAGTDSAEPEKSAQKPAVSVRKIFLLVWASGAALLGLWFLFCNLRYGRQLRAGVLRAIAPKEGRPAVRLTQTALSPCLFGLFTPAIYVTMDCAQDEQLLHHCAEHEYTHYLHRDHIWAVLRGVCLALHWFNPLVWWAAALSRTAERCFVIGGGSVYQQMLPFCDAAYVTKVHVTPESDTFFPNLDEDKDWYLAETLQSGEENGIAYEMCLYRRK